MKFTAKRQAFFLIAMLEGINEGYEFSAGISTHIMELFDDLFSVVLAYSNDPGDDDSIVDTEELFFDKWLEPEKVREDATNAVNVVKENCKIFVDLAYKCELESKAWWVCVGTLRECRRFDLIKQMLVTSGKYHEFVAERKYWKEKLENIV